MIKIAKKNLPKQRKKEKWPKVSYPHCNNDPILTPYHKNEQNYLPKCQTRPMPISDSKQRFSEVPDLEITDFRE